MMTPEMLDIFTGALGFLFTILILSYLIGDNPLFRIAVYAFVGVASGYAATVIFWQVLVPRLWLPTLSALQSGSMGEVLYVVMPWLGTAFIIMKISPRLAGMARITMAFLVGAGAAVTLAGALTGTLLPQFNATINVFGGAAGSSGFQMIELLFSGGVILLGAVTSLAYFHFGARPAADGSMRRFVPIEILAWIGRIFIGSTLGVIFAGVYAAALTALIERISSIIDFVSSLAALLGLS